MTRPPLLSRQEGLVVKGLCIIVIMMHNYLHVNGFAAENEFTFNPEHVSALWNILCHPDLNLLLHLISFSPPYSLFPFLFVSGYGLVKKYELGDIEWNRSRFITSHYIKLFRLAALPVVVAFVVYFIIHGRQPLTPGEVLAELMLVGNLMYQNISIYPFVYWFLGMLMQLYLLYALVLHRGPHDSLRRHAWMLMALVVICGLMQMSCSPMGYGIYFLKVNLVGYVGPFAAGIVVARHCDHITLSRWQWAGVMLVSATVMAVSCCNYYLWIWGWIPSVVFCVSVVKTFTPLSCRFVTWLGGISATLLVCHPIVREVICAICKYHVRSGLVIFLLVSIVMAWGYARLLARGK